MLNWLVTSLEDFPLMCDSRKYPYPPPPPNGWGMEIPKGWGG